MKFRGKVAVWWYLIIVILNVALIGMIVKYGLHYISYFYILPAGLLDLYLIPVCFANYVELDKKKIFIRDRFTLSFCASADVVLLACRNKKNVVVSLKDNKAFMDELQKLNKKIKVYI